MLLAMINCFKIFWENDIMFKNERLIIYLCLVILSILVLFYRCSDNKLDTYQKSAEERIYDENADKKELQKVMKSIQQRDIK